MIASFLRNFIFIKTKKTASTTVEMTLAPCCGPDDIVTPLGNAEELQRGEGKPLCRNFMADPALEDEIRALISSGARNRVRKKLIEQAVYFNHMSAAEAKAKLPPAFWQNACKVTVERHPYERVVSKAYFNYAKDRPFETYLDEVVRSERYTNSQFYTIDGEVAVDEILRQETLQEDLRRLGVKLGIPIPDSLAQAKSRHRTDRRPARDILTGEQKEIVYRVCRREFELLGYER